MLIEAILQKQNKFDVQKVRQDFPALQIQAHGHPLVYLDNAATTQKPKIVIDTLQDYYQTKNANIHRGVHYLSEQATAAFESARKSIAKFIKADDPKNCIFVRGATEGINLVAQSYARPRLRKGDEILITQMEHHANIIPWQQVCEQTGASLIISPINQKGELILDALYERMSAKTKLLALTHISNALGTINPVQEIISFAKTKKIPVLIDGAQAVSHIHVDLQSLDCDFYVFSGHKTYGPTGIGVLYGKSKHLSSMPPYQTGGDMVLSVSFEKTEFQAHPHKFEAGTPHISGAIGLAAALNYIEQIGLENIHTQEQDLLRYATEQAETIPGLEIIGQANHKTSLISFTLAGIHPHDLATILDQQGIAVRSGHHCAMPLMDFYKVPATTRASFAFYNTREEIDCWIAGLIQAQKLFQS